MHAQLIDVMESCAQGALTGQLSFPEIVARLAAIDVERYHADYTRQELTYYLTSGESLVVALPHDECDMAQQFSSTAVAEAVRQNQRNEHTYADFVRKTMTAGCVG